MLSLVYASVYLVTALARFCRVKVFFTTDLHHAEENKIRESLISVSKLGKCIIVTFFATPTPESDVYHSKRDIYHTASPLQICPEHPG